MTKIRQKLKLVGPLHEKNNREKRGRKQKIAERKREVARVWQGEFKSSLLMSFLVFFSESSE